MKTTVLLRFHSVPRVKWHAVDVAGLIFVLIQLLKYVYIAIAIGEFNSCWASSMTAK